MRIYAKHAITYLKILPLIDTLEVNGHFLSTYTPSFASCGVLKPTRSMHVNFVSFRWADLDCCRRVWLTETDLLGESLNLHFITVFLFGQSFLWVQENISLLLESFFGLNFAKEKIINLISYRQYWDQLAHLSENLINIHRQSMRVLLVNPSFVLISLTWMSAIVKFVLFANKK